MWDSMVHLVQILLLQRYWSPIVAAWEMVREVVSYLQSSGLLTRTSAAPELANAITAKETAEDKREDEIIARRLVSCQQPQ